MKILFISCFLFLGSNIAAQFSVQFEKGDWAEAKEKAQEEGKLIFIDGFTTWCEPCKMMDIQVFNRSHVARFFNRNFVNYKMDMEKGSGPILSLNYGVREFPTFLFITPDGTLVHKFDGYKHADQMLANSKPALEPDRRRLALDQRYENGDRKPDFLYNYTFERLQRMDDSHLEVVSGYLASTPDWNTDRTIKFIFQFMDDIDSDLFKHMAKNRMRYEEVVGKEEVSRTIDIMVNNRIFNSNPAPTVDEVEALYKMAYPNKGKEMAADYAMDAYQEAGDFDKYADVAMAYFDDDTPLKKMRALAEEFYKKAEEKRHLEAGYNWAQLIAQKNKSVEALYRVALFEIELDKPAAKQSVKAVRKMAKKQKHPLKSKLDVLWKKVKKG